MVSKMWFARYDLVSQQHMWDFISGVLRSHLRYSGFSFIPFVLSFLLRVDFVKRSLLLFRGTFVNCCQESTVSYWQLSVVQHSFEYVLLQVTKCVGKIISKHWKFYLHMDKHWWLLTKSPWKLASSANTVLTVNVLCPPVQYFARCIVSVVVWIEQGTTRLKLQTVVC
jgi:hypothetical protein